MKEIHLLLKSFDFKVYTGGIGTIFFGAISRADIEIGLRIVFLLISIAVGIVTYRYTQEKRRFLKAQREEAED